jgi:hypothetical protein
MNPAILLQIIELMLTGVPEIISDVENLIAGIKGQAPAPTTPAVPEVTAAMAPLEAKLEAITAGK